jgi:predicted DNA-binding transcriptional regulator AlpA
VEKPQPQPRRLLRRQEVLKKVRIGRTALDDALERGVFPLPTTLFPGGRALVWDEQEVDDYIEQRFAARKRTRRAAKNDRGDKQ